MIYAFKVKYIINQETSNNDLSNGVENITANVKILDDKDSLYSEVESLSNNNNVNNAFNILNNNQNVTKSKILIKFKLIDHSKFY